jgi:hypothetical protein
MSETTSEVKEYDNAAEVLDIEAAIVQLDIVDDELISSVACDERAESDLATAEVLTRTTLDNWANPTVIGPNNKEIHKRKLASMINKDRCVTSKSMDRKYRVQGVARHGARNGDRDDSSGHLAYRFGEEDSNPNDEILYKRGDLFALMVRAKQNSTSNEKLSYMVMARAACFGSGDSTQIQMFWNSPLDQNGRISLNIIDLQEMENNRADGAGQLLVMDKVGALLKNVVMSCVIPIAPKLELIQSINTDEPLCIMRRILSLENLSSAHKILSSHRNVHSVSGTTIIVPILVNSVPQFLFNGDGVAIKTFVCSICNPPVSIGKHYFDAKTMARSLRNHMAAHIYEHRSGDGVSGITMPFPTEPCAYCCGGTCKVSASGETKKKNGIVPSENILVMCKTFNSDIPNLKRKDYKSVKLYPSSQQPYECPICKVYIWSMNLNQHFEEHHAGSEISQPQTLFKGCSFPTGDEKAKVLEQFGTTTAKKA